MAAGVRYGVVVPAVAQPPVLEARVEERDAAAGETSLEVVPGRLGGGVLHVSKQQRGGSQREQAWLEDHRLELEASEGGEAGEEAGAGEEEQQQEEQYSL